MAKCQDDDKYVNPCAGLYGSEQIIDSIVHRYKLNNAVWFGEVYKSYMVPKNYNCDTIHLTISSSNMPFDYNDTFAISVAKIFFNDSVNKNVNFLNIDLIDYWSYIGSAKAEFKVSRQDINKENVTLLPTYLKEMRYEIKDTIPYTVYSAMGTEKGLRIVVKLQEDYKKIKELASTIKAQYDSMIKMDELSQFEIDFIVQSLVGKLCKSKTYNVFYRKTNNNL